MISEPVKDPDGMGAEFSRVNEVPYWTEEYGYDNRVGRLQEVVDPDLEAALARFGNGKWYERLSPNLAGGDYFPRQEGGM